MSESEVKRVEVRHEVRSRRRMVAAPASRSGHKRAAGLQAAGEGTFPLSRFSKDQRVSHAAVVENKHLGHALAIVKAQQDLQLASES